MARIITSFVNRQDDLSITADCVLYKLHNNEFFSDPPPALAALKKLLPEYQTSLAKAMTRDKLMVAIKNNKKNEVAGLLQELAEYVTIASKGDKSIILSSGFDVESEYNGKKGLLSPIDMLIVELGPPGEATTKAKHAKGARAYMHQYTTEPPGPNSIWISEGIAMCKYTFNRLASDKRHWFRVVAIGSGIQREFSPIVSRVIQ